MVQKPEHVLLQVTNGKTGFLAYETRFWFPSEQSRSYSPFYYSYEVCCASTDLPCVSALEYTPNIDPCGDHGKIVMHACFMIVVVDCASPYV